MAPAPTVTIKGTGKQNAGLILEARLVRMGINVGMVTYNQNITATGDWERIVTFPNGVTLQDGDMLTVMVGTPSTGETKNGMWMVKP